MTNLFPVLPWKRKSTHFSVGDTVMVYYEKQNEWRKGTIVKGYKYHDGYVSFYLDTDKIPKYDYLEQIDNSDEEKVFVRGIGKIAHSRGIGNCLPIILRSDEYTFFVSNREVWKPWKNLVTTKMYNNKFIILNKPPAIV